MPSKEESCIASIACFGGAKHAAASAISHSVLLLRPAKTKLGSRPIVNERLDHHFFAWFPLVHMYLATAVHLGRTVCLHAEHKKWRAPAVPHEKKKKFWIEHNTDYCCGATTWRSECDRPVPTLWHGRHAHGTHKNATEPNYQTTSTVYTTWGQS